MSDETGQAARQSSTGPGNPVVGQPALASLVSMRVITLFVLMRRSLNQRYRREFNLTELEWRIMTRLSADTASSLGALATFLMLDRGQLSRAVKGMVARGLLVSRRKKGGPEIAISLSEEGLALRREMERRVQEREEFLTRGLPQEDLEIASRSLAHMIDRAQSLLDENGHG